MSAQAQTLDQLLAQRHSCRAFLPREVPRATIEQILLTAQRTSSWCNAQPWQVIVTSGAATDRFRQAMLQAHGAGGGSFDFAPPREYNGVYLDRRRATGFALYQAVGVERGDKVGYARQGAENFRLFGAPHVAIITTDEALGIYGAVDVGGYVQVLLLALQAHGIAAIPQAALASHSPTVRQHFGLGDDRRVVCGVSFGYGDPDHPANSFRTDRAGLDEAVTWLDE